MKPIFLVNGHDYTRYLAWEGLKPVRNDLDANGSGRNLLDGLMYRHRIAGKQKWTVSFNRLSGEVLSQLEKDMDADFMRVTLLDAKENRYVERSYYSSTINEGVQRYIGGETVYDGVTFNLTER